MTQMYAYNQYNTNKKNTNVLYRFSPEEVARQQAHLELAKATAEALGKKIEDVTTQEMSKYKISQVEARSKRPTTGEAIPDIQAIKQEEAEAMSQAEQEISTAAETPSKKWIATRKELLHGDEVQSQRDLYAGPTTAEMSSKGKKKAKREARSKTTWGRIVNKLRFWER